MEGSVRLKPMKMWYIVINFYLFNHGILCQTTGLLNVMLNLCQT